MTETSDDERLNQILKKAHNSDYLLPDEIECLTCVFLSTRPDASTIRAKAYVVLSAFCQGIRGKEKDVEVGTKAIVNAFCAIVTDYLGDTQEISLMTGISFLTALFQVDSLVASSIFLENGLVENMMDAVDLSPTNHLCQEVAHLLSQACGHKTCRAIITPQISRWLQFKTRQPNDAVLQSAASVALIKLTKGASSDNPETGAPDVRYGQNDELAESLMNMIVSGQSASYASAVEGLAYLSTDPIVKESLSINSAFLKKLFSLVSTQKDAAYKTPTDRNPTLIFGIILFICNLGTFRPRLTEEQKQVENLKQMTKAGKGLSEAEETTALLDDDEHVKARIRLLIASGVLPVFPSAIAGTDSTAVRLNVGKCLLSIIEEKENRGMVLQAGGAKVLLTIIQRALSTQSGEPGNKQSPLSSMDLNAIQALAKLAITSAPVHVFGPNVGAIYDAIRPFSMLLQHPSSNLLQCFEAIMALTNLASHDADVASRIAKADGLLNKVELLLLEEHTLIRRASVELICNLIVGSDEALERYSGESPNSANKIHVLLALTDEDDLPTRLAASGALATVTAVHSACNALVALQFDKHRFLRLMTQLIDPSVVDKESEEPLGTNHGLVHRGVVCVGNVFRSITDSDVRGKITKEATESGLLRALVLLVQGKGVVQEPSILQQAAEALKSLVNKK